MKDSKLAKLYIPSANDVSFSNTDPDFVNLNSVNGALVNIDQRLDRFESLLNVKNSDIVMYVGPNCPENAPSADSNGKHPTIFGSYFGDGSSSNPYSLISSAMTKLGTYRFTGNARPRVAFYPGTYDEYGVYRYYKSANERCKIVHWIRTQSGTGIYLNAPTNLYTLADDPVTVSDINTVGLKLYTGNFTDVVGFIYSMTGTSDDPGTITLGVYRTDSNGSTVFENTGVQYTKSETYDAGETGIVRSKVCKLDHIDCTSITRYIEWCGMQYTATNNKYSFSLMQRDQRTDLRTVKIVSYVKSYASGGYCPFMVYSNWLIVGIDFEEDSGMDPYFQKTSSCTLIGAYSSTAQVSIRNSSFKNIYAVLHFYEGDVSGGAYAAITGCVFDNSERSTRWSSDAAIVRVKDAYTTGGAILFDNCEFIGDFDTNSEKSLCGGIETTTHTIVRNVKGSLNIPDGNGNVIVRPIKSIIRFKNINKCFIGNPTSSENEIESYSRDINNKTLAFITGGGGNSKTTYRLRTASDGYSDIDIAVGVAPVVRQILVGEDPNNPSAEVWVPINTPSNRRTLNTPFTFGSGSSKQTETDFDISDSNFEYGVWIIFEHDYSTTKRSWLNE